MRIKTKKDRRHRISLRLRKRDGRHAGAAAPERVPQRVAHLRAGDRRSRRRDAGVGVERRAGACGRSSSDGARGGNQGGAKAIGRIVAERLKEKGITRVVFDRGGFLYHGRVKAVADAAREAGLEF